MPSHLPVSQVVRTGSQVPVQPAVSRTRGDQVPSSPLNRVQPAEPRVQQRASRARQQIDPDSDSKVKKRRGPPLGGGDLDEEVELPPATTGYSDIHLLESTSGANEDTDAMTFDLIPSEFDQFNLGFTPVLLTAIRFTNVQIPNGAIITSADLEAIAHGTPETTLVDIYCEDVDNSEAFETNQTISGRSRTTEFVTSANLAVEDGSLIPFPDISDPVQEVIDRPGWAAGSALSVIIIGNSGTNNITFDNVRLRLEWEE